MNAAKNISASIEAALERAYAHAPNAVPMPNAASGTLASLRKAGALKREKITLHGRRVTAYAITDLGRSMFRRVPIEAVHLTTGEWLALVRAVKGDGRMAWRDDALYGPALRAAGFLGDGGGWPMVTAEGCSVVRRAAAIGNVVATRTTV